MGALKNATKCLWRWQPDRRYNFFNPAAHLCHHIYNLKYRCMWHFWRWYAMYNRKRPFRQSCVALTRREEIDRVDVFCCLSCTLEALPLSLCALSILRQLGAREGGGGGVGRRSTPFFAYHVALLWSSEHLQCTLLNKTLIQINISQIWKETFFRCIHQF